MVIIVYCTCTVVYMCYINTEKPKSKGMSNIHKYMYNEVKRLLMTDYSNKAVKHSLDNDNNNIFYNYTIG